MTHICASALHHQAGDYPEEYSAGFIGGFKQLLGAPSQWAALAAWLRLITCGRAPWGPTLIRNGRTSYLRRITLRERTSATCAPRMISGAPRVTARRKTMATITVQAGDSI